MPRREIPYWHLAPNHRKTTADMHFIGYICTVHMNSVGVGNGEQLWLRLSLHTSSISPFMASSLLLCVMSPSDGYGPRTPDCTTTFHYYASTPKSETNKFLEMMMMMISLPPVSLHSGQGQTLRKKQRVPGRKKERGKSLIMSLIIILNLFGRVLIFRGALWGTSPESYYSLLCTVLRDSTITIRGNPNLGVMTWPGSRLDFLSSILYLRLLPLL